jgi:hypothetical protein
MRLRRILPAMSLALFAFAAPAFAAWQNSPFVNLPVSTAASDQYAPVGISDGTGGAIITWYDYRGGATPDIYAQHVLASGAVDAAWPANGRAVCVAANNQSLPTIVSDGAGGAIITWQDLRNGASNDVYAQHVLASGAVDAAWPADGRALCTAANNQAVPTIASDGAGGAIVTWYDQRGGSADIYAQHVLASGAVDPAWPADGRALCTAASNQYLPTIAPDGAGGAIVTWYDYRSGTQYDIYAQHVLASGAVDAAWPADGRVLCTAADTQYNPIVVTDGAGGAIVTWYDLRNGANWDIYAQHVLAGGAVDGGWPANGRALCTAAGNQQYPMLIADGAGGAIVTWVDARSGNLDIYAQHVLENGAVDPGWPADGRALCVIASEQSSPMIVSDGTGGAIVSWNDSRSGSYDIYAQHVLASGAVDPAWPADGRLLCAATSSQVYPTIVADGAGGALVAWQDYRSNVGYDIYAQRVARYGYLGTPEAEIVSVRDVPRDQGGALKVSWNASYLEGDPYNLVNSYKVFRSVPTGAAALAIARGARVVPITEDAAAIVEGERTIHTQTLGGKTYFWEYVSTVNSDFLPNYSCIVPTLQDSTSAGYSRTAVMIQARSTTSAQHWESLPDSAYSVDNLPPYAPAPFMGTYAAGSASLHWSPNADVDLANYRLYRGTSSTFVPGPANLVGAPVDTAYIDAAAAPYYYKLTAIDVHGNESPATLLLPSGALAVEGALPSQLAFAAPAPNPARGMTTLRFALPRDASVRLALYDVSGRRVRMLVQGAQPAGEHTTPWDLRDDAGRTVGAGLYFARFEAEGRTFTQRVMTLR